MRDLWVNMYLKKMILVIDTSYSCRSTSQNKTLNKTYYNSRFKKIQLFMVHILYSRLLPLYSDAEKNAQKILSQLFSPNQSMQLQ